MKLSIIIPVYNSERYLGKCLESVFDQDLDSSEYEVIVINDGSTDGSEQIITGFSSQYYNITYLIQKNQGVSVARNAALDIVKGNYITFVDSDDEIRKNSLKEILAKLQKDNLDILYPIVDTYVESGERLGTIAFYGKYDEIKEGILQERRTFPPTFYRRKIIADIRFNKELSFGEDTVFNAKAQAISKRVSFTEIPYYKYFARQNSLSRQAKSESLFNGLITAIIDIKEFQDIHFSHDEDSRKYFDKVYKVFVNIIIGEFLQPVYNVPRYTELVKLLREEKLLYILSLLNGRYPFIDKSYATFTLYHKFATLLTIFKHKISSVAKL